MSWLDDLLSGGSGGFDPNDPYAGNTLPATPDVPPDQLAADARADPNVPAFGDPYAGNTIDSNAPAGGWGAGSGSGLPPPPKPLTQKLADALGKLGAAGKDQAHQPAPVQARLDLIPRSAQSQAFRGQSTLGTLLQLLMQQRGQYGPPGTGGGGGRGLLGM
jgi:hypothetical protein